jgi:geranylgeranyl pyrophosphate synthase
MMLQQIHGELARDCLSPVLRDMATYYFDGQGKAVRPVLTQMMARAVNAHLGLKDTQVLQLHVGSSHLLYCFLCFFSSKLSSSTFSCLTSPG